MSSTAVPQGVGGIDTESCVRDLSAIEKILRCEICRDLMAFPFILNCGHTFCYSCEFEWLKSHRSCPRCRARVRTKPILVYVLKEIVDVIIRGRGQKSTTSELYDTEHYKEQEEALARHGQDPFPGLFRSTEMDTAGGMVADPEDHVLRCTRCHWEVEGPECL